jgi:hypothetical protein
MELIKHNNLSEFKDGLVLKKTIERESYLVIDEIDDLNLIDTIVEKARGQINQNLEKTNVKASRTDWKCLVNDKYFISFLNKIKPTIQKIYTENFIITDVWANFYKEPNKDFCNLHHHSGTTAFCGILYCTDGPGPGTYFKDFDLNIKEKKGRFILFDPLLLHEVKPYPYNNERITIAWNFHELKKWNH